MIAKLIITVNAPLSKRSCVDILIVEGAGITCTGFCPSVRVNTHFQAHCVDLSCGAIDPIWKLPVIRNDLAGKIVSPKDLVRPTICRGISLEIPPPPALTNGILYTVDIDIFITCIFETEINNFLGCCEEDRLADIAPKRLFRFVSQKVPLHRRYSIYRSMN